MRPAKFKDVAQHYIGCKLQIGECIGTFNEYCPKDLNQITCYDIPRAYHSIDDVKPILYNVNEGNFTDLPPSTQDKVLVALVNVQNTKKSNELSEMKYWANLIDTARALHIDIDGLVENGEAIDAFSLTVNPYINEPKK